MVFEELSSQLELDASDYISSAEDAAESTEDLSNSSEDLSDSLGDISGIATGAALAGVGAGAQKALDSTQGLRETMGRTAESTELTRDETSKLAQEMSDATFPIDDAVGAMDALAQQGVDTEKELRNTATAADMIADATDSSAESIAKNAAPALEAMGEDVTNLEDHMDTFTFIARNSTMSVEDFSGMVRKMGPELEEMGMGVEDTAMFLSALEEKGMDSRTAMREFRQAARDADGDQQALKETLGLTSDELEAQKDALSEAEGMMHKHADAANESLSTMDTLGAVFDDVTLQFAGVLQPLSALAPALMGVGSLMAGLSATGITAAGVMGTVSAVMGSVAAAVGAVALPLLAVVAALAAVGIAYQENLFGFRDAVQTVVDVVTDVLGRLADIVSEVLEGDFAEAWDLAKQSVTDVTDWFTNEAIPQFVDAITGLGEKLQTAAQEAFSALVDSAVCGSRR